LTEPLALPRPETIPGHPRIKDYTDANSFALHYEYDAAGNLSWIIYPDNQKVQYCYDNQNRLKRVLTGSDSCLVPEESYAQDQQAIYAYDAAGRLISFRNFNGITTTYGYDNANRLTKIESSVASFIFDGPGDLDANGNIKNVTENVPLVGVPLAEQTNYFYNDQKNRLDTKQNPTTVNYTYDEEGQLENAGADNYQFDYNHRLTGIGSQATFTYDGLGNRVIVTRGGTTTYYIYDPYGNLLAEADADKNITRKYIYGKGLIAVEATGSQSSRYCYHFNPTGSTIAITKMDQAVENSYYYDPFGKILAHDEAFDQPFKFVGQYGVMTEPAADGIYYMRARYYDSTVGRFISEDPLGFEGGDVNLYAYVRNNPVNLIDPLGLWAIGDPLPQGLVDFSAGFGDTLTSGFGLTNLFGLPSLTEAARKGLNSNGVVDPCSGAYKGGELAGYAWGIAFNASGYATGYEFTIGKNLRIAPWGNRTGNPYGELPHYHRRIFGPDGRVVRNGSIDWHRPWQKGW